MKFRANKVFAGVIEEDGILLIGFYYNTLFSNKSMYFIIQDSTTYDEQDLKLGMNSYYLEKNSPSNGSYGGLKSLNITRTRLVAYLNELGNKRLLESAITVDFDCNDKDYSNLLAKMKYLALKHGLVLTHNV